MNCIIVDDEPLARDEMQSLISEVSEIEILGKFSNARQALDFLKEQPVDLIFLDIQMPLVTGIDFAQQISGQSMIIFTTAYPQYALKSYELDALDYLLKPIEKLRLEKAIHKFLSYKNLLSDTTVKNTVEANTEDFLFIKSERRFYKIYFQDIRFVEGLKDYVVIYTKSQKLITAMNLKIMHQKLPVRSFQRVSKSYVINVDFIDSFDNHTIYMDENEIPLGEVYKKEFFERYLGGSLNAQK
ncbi:LytR/AlgR family response regulator transcription factor [Sphingobacterium spiritivorum]|uniref:LytR/AlgR family response regulator transcription factor n=1 Tax=Sphingobacterium spiritivorum TaxID=258 RepID=UPI003DA5D207